jgi:hypothetical protein
VTVYWQIEPEWVGETAFIVGGGPSVRTIDLELLRGQNVIAINTSYEAVPFAQFLIFSDYRWWDHHQSKLDKFEGRIVCCSRTPGDARLLMVRRKIPPGFDQPNDCLAVQFTTATGAMGLAVKLGAKRIVMMGIDGRNASDGKTHHHRGHPWIIVDGWEAKHRADLQKMVQPLKDLGIEILLATPSAYEDLWPRIDLRKIVPRAQENETQVADHDQRTLGPRRQHLSEAVCQEAK